MRRVRGRSRRCVFVAGPGHTAVWMVVARVDRWRESAQPSGQVRADSRWDIEVPGEPELTNGVEPEPVLAAVRRCSLTLAWSM
ncbi:MAG: hypothetical protein K0V04_34765 [Deltaproteobacteria bacterium]|nr:hypothetical protein [Deltaproteobacteria bacterium]